MNCFNLMKFFNPAITYLISRYFTYGIQFLNSILIALYLGPQQLGIWGFILLIIQYINQFNLGINHSVNTIGAINKQKVKYVSLILGNAVIMIGLLSFFWLILFFINLKFNLNFGNKYHFTQYSILVLIIAITSYYNSLFLNILRIYSKINLISFIQSIFPFATLITLFTLKHNGLLLNLVKVYAITSSCILLLALLTLPIKVHINFRKKAFLLIQQKGWHLFIYNTSFYLISLTTR